MDFLLKYVMHHSKVLVRRNWRFQVAQPKRLWLRRKELFIDCGSGLTFASRTSGFRAIPAMSTTAHMTTVIAVCLLTFETHGSRKYHCWFSSL